MERVKDVFTHLLNNEKFSSTFEKVKSSVYANPHIREFLNEQGITKTSAEKGLAKLYEFHEQQQHCQACPGLANCPNVMKGYSPELIYTYDAIDVTYHRCPLKEQDDEEQKQRKLFESLYIPKEVVHARFSDLDKDVERFEAIQLADRYVQNFELGKTRQGLYFYGSFGVGKTFLLCAIANELALTKGVRSIIVYTPDFFRELKNAIGSDTLNEKLNYIKTVPLLILDDIGAEVISGWIRDEVLGSILQFRMMEGLPTLYSSNYDYDGLEDHLAYSDRSGTELLKAKRIMERIRHYTTAQFIGGSNRREVRDVSP